MTKETIIKIIDQNIKRRDLSEWEQKFLKNIKEKVSNDYLLSAKETLKLSEIDDREEKRAR